MDYKPKLYFWEFIIMFRKILSLAVTLIAYTKKIDKSLVLLIILIISLIEQSIYMPFIDDELNRAEYKSILVGFITVFSGILFSTESINEKLSFFLFFIIIFANVHFLFTCFCMIMEIIVQKYQNYTTVLKFSKLYKRIIAGFSFLISVSKLI